MHRNPLFVSVVFAVVIACGGKDDTSTATTGATGSGAATGATGATGTSSTVGADGGTVTLGDVSVTIPAGALTADTEIGIADVSDSVAASDFTAAGAAYAFTPHGTTFAQPVTIRLPQDGTGDVAMRLDDEADTDWELVAETTFGADYAELQVTSFSVYLVSSYCSTYCAHVTNTCGAAASFSNGSCVSSCQQNSPGPGQLAPSCVAPVEANFSCLMGSASAADFDCATGDPAAATCAATQGTAQSCNNPVCSTIDGAWLINFDTYTDQPSTAVSTGSNSWQFTADGANPGQMPPIDLTLGTTGTYEASFTTDSLYASDSVVATCDPNTGAQQLVFTFTLDTQITVTLHR